MKMNLDEIVNRLQELNTTQIYEVVVATGVSYPTILKIRNHAEANVQTKTLSKLADHFAENS